MPLDGAKTRGQIGVGSARSAAHHAAYTSQLAIVVTARGPRAIADPFFAFSRPHASRRQHYTWNLDRAVDAFFDGSWQNALVDAAEAKALAEAEKRGAAVLKGAGGKAGGLLREAEKLEKAAARAQ